MNYIYNQELYRKNISPALLESKDDDLICPECKNKFNLFYSRVFACKGCPHAVEGCEFVRCPNCDSEFLLEEVKSKTKSKQLDNYMGNIIKKYLELFGKSPRR